MTYAEDLNYWKSSKSSPDSWMEKTIGLIEGFGGQLISSAFGEEHQTGRAAYMLRFSRDGDTFNIVWPVLPSKVGDSFSARRQAATMMYHDVKAKCLAGAVLGARTAFLPWYEIKGKPMYQLSDRQLLDETPSMLLIENQTGQ